MQTVDKVIDILETFLKSQNGLGIVDLANQSGLNVTTSYRIVSTLIKREYLIQPKKRGKYYLSPKLIRFNSIIKMSTKVREVARPFLIQISDKTNESVNLAILDAYEALYIDHIASSHNLRIFTQTGGRVPLHCTGVGKIFLAHMSEGDLASYLNNRSLISFTANTITNIDVLKKELLTIRQEGVAIDNEEMELGIKCIAAPVKSVAGYTVACVSVSGPAARIRGDIEKNLKSLVKHYTSDISQDLGFGQ